MTEEPEDNRAKTHTHKKYEPDRESRSAFITSVRTDRPVDGRVLVLSAPGGENERAVIKMSSDRCEGRKKNSWKRCVQSSQGELLHVFSSLYETTNRNIWHRNIYIWYMYVMMTDGWFLLPVMVFLSYLWLPTGYFCNCTWLHSRGCVGDNKVQCGAILVSINTSYFYVSSLKNQLRPSMLFVWLQHTIWSYWKAFQPHITDEKLDTLIYDNTLS